MKRLIINVYLLLLMLLLPNMVLAKEKTVILATTTSAYDSGLLDSIVPDFERQSGYKVKIIAVGSGQAVMLGRRGEADVLLTHSPKDEEKLMLDGLGLERKAVMHNDFLLLGPKDDPAKVREAKNIMEAFRLISQKGALFISRGDSSGTHVKELAIWKSIGVNPSGAKWYQETGSGMGATLSVADEKNGYVFSDRGTFLAFKKNLGLIVVSSGDKALLNFYHVITINPAKFKNVNYMGAKAFADFLVSKETQYKIGRFGVDKFGEPLFIPDALR